MSNKLIDTINPLDSLTWYESVRLRPAMYIGIVNTRGFIETLKDIFLGVETNLFSIELLDDAKAKIGFNVLSETVDNNWGQFKFNSTNPFTIDIAVLNALSQQFNIQFLDTQQDLIQEQTFEKGILVKGETIDTISCAYVQIEFQLDKSIWGEDFEWDITYLTHHFREFAYLNRHIKFKIQYKEEGERCIMIYHFKNGLKDRIHIELLNGSGSYFFLTHIDTIIEDFQVEIAFAFREYYWVDMAYLNSYVYNYRTHEHGTHIDGLLKGLTYGIMKYFQKYNLTAKYRISEKGVKESLVAIINIKPETPLFSGCVKNKLANSEVIEPLTNYIADLLFKQIEADEVATKKLIRKFEIR